MLKQRALGIAHKAICGNATLFAVTFYLARYRLARRLLRPAFAEEIARWEAKANG